MCGSSSLNLPGKLCNNFAKSLIVILKDCGLDLYQGVVRDKKKAGVLEPAISKIKSLKFVTMAAIINSQVLFYAFLVYQF